MSNGVLDYLDVTIAVVGLLQGGFLCLLLRSEGVRALAANRWMMLFLCCLMLNLLADVGDTFGSDQVQDLIVLFFFPSNFVIGPAIYLYFRELSGTPDRRAWVHFVPAAVIFNLLAWLFTIDGFGAVPATNEQSVIVETVKAVCWLAIFVQAAFYIHRLWRLSETYFRQTQQQLGADRRAMRRWIAVILGGVCLIFVTVLLSRIIAFYIPEPMAMTGTGLAFVLVLFAMTYVIATRPALFVMADWPDGDAGKTAPAPRPAIPATTGRAQVASPNPDDNLGNDAGDEVHDSPDAGLTGGLERATASDIRPTPLDAARSLLDDDGVERALAKLADIRGRRELLLDPLVSLPKLARAVGVSPNQLSYVLNRHLRQNFFDFVNQTRIEEARAVLVLEPERTILDIALSVGFNSKSTFNLAFRKFTGETPSAVRDAALKNTAG
ncbi:helix-turn-helix domain-containing protein [Thalassospira sp. GO-4]|jgi:AraC-like DNA-binding protein|uniref:helix-turn-helix domain-containing protein n=1 Tax=Thalassospira sp. GO-4 TaxID=2946605 RepID=UPI00202547C4|nr:helix-turn-helix domain-containing protein [Thalassospira sp. GO-4]URK19529.1 helix-turn-helix domain-containing protein [Thalassospira sp. GO-4]